VNLNFVFADDDTCTIVIDKNGASQSGTIFRSDGIGDHGSWYPGYSDSDKLRVNNAHYKVVNIKKLGMDISLKQYGEPLSLEHQNAKDYLTHMKIKIEYNNPIQKALKGVVFEGSFDDLREGVPCDLSVSRGDYIDFEYTIMMDMGAGNNTQSIDGDIDFIIDLSGDSASDNNNNGDSHNGDDDDPSGPKPH